MKVNKFLEKLKHIESLPTTYYSVAGGNWAMWNGKSWNFDCVILIKAILWGWNGNKNHAHGGANYGSNGVYDDNADTILNRCYSISRDFSHIEPGELVWMPGHVGIYIGNDQVIECTAAWERKVLVSNIDTSGRRTRNGYQVYTWQKHAKLKYIDYSENTNDSANTSENVHIVKAGETLSSIAQLYGTTWQTLAKINNLSNPNLIHIGDKLLIRKESSSPIPIFYIVKRGDTLWKIASKYGITTQKLYDDNRSVIGTNPDLIEVGMKLEIKR